MCVFVCVDRSKGTEHAFAFFGVCMTSLWLDHMVSAENGWETAVGPRVA